MFRRLAESYSSNSDQSYSDQRYSNEGFSPHTNHIQSQQIYHDVRPTMIPSATSGLTGFDNAIATVTTYDQSYQPYAVKHPNDIFIQTPSADLTAQAAACASGSIDDLIRDKNPSSRLGCGWIYTPPNQNSSYPVVSRGALGNRDGPINMNNLPAYKKWFFDLQAAKKQALIDKCKALNACTEVDSAAFNGTCGFCTDTNQGVPIDSVGKPLYTNDRASCSTTSIVTSRSSCPVPQTNGPQPMVDRTCEPINGRLSIPCLRQTVLSAGCNQKGALADALLGSQVDVRNWADQYNSKLQQYRIDPPMNINLFRDGTTTVTAAMQEIRKVSAAAQHPTNTGNSTAARDLCLQKGTLESYDMCADRMVDSAPPPFETKCLQQAFLKMGGTQRGRAYPNASNMDMYNSMSTLGAVKQYWAKKLGQMKGREGFTDYQTQSTALKDMLGIVPEEMIVRAPYKQGVEVLWFVAAPSNPGRVTGFLRRTIEPKLITFEQRLSNTPQIGGLPYRCMLQLTDLRAPTDFSTRFQVTVDDGFWIAVNQPPEIDEKAMTQVFYTVDKPGFFENLGLQGPTTYTAGACSTFKAGTPNIMKLYHEDAGGGGESFLFTMIPCAGTPPTDPMYLSLACEARAPFLCFEVSKRGRFEELRNSGMFNQFIMSWGTDIFTRTDDKTFVPGKKPFIRVNSAGSMINLENIAYQSWKTMTAAIRIQVKPVKETIIAFALGPIGSWFCNIVTTPISDSRAGIHIEYRFRHDGPIQYMTTVYELALQTWYHFRIDNLGTGFVIHCDTIDAMIANKGRSGSSTTVNGPKQLWDVNGTWYPAPGQVQQACNIMFGTDRYKQWGWSSMHASGMFTYDIAWVHFFDSATNDDDIYRDAMSNWIYTQFPNEDGSYSS